VALARLDTRRQRYPLRRSASPLSDGHYSHVVKFLPVISAFYDIVLFFYWMNAWMNSDLRSFAVVRGTKECY